MREVAVEAMLPFLRESYANPSGAHSMARHARTAIEESREVVATELGFSPHEVVFTSGGTESDNLALRGVVVATGGMAACAATEHHAVLHPVHSVDGLVIGVQRDGSVDFEDLARQLDHARSGGRPVAIVSVMVVNNETGLITDLRPVREVIDRHAPGAVLHTDAVQGVNWVDPLTAFESADLVSLSGHKFGGPKGVGVLAVRDHVRLAPQILGGGQEAERRSGTHNTAGIVALASALGELGRTRTDTNIRLARERDRLADGVCAAVPGVAETVDRAQRAAGIVQLVIQGIETEALLVLLERGGVMASAASSCASGAMEPSHVLAAMGYDRIAAAGSLRLSLGWSTTSEDIDRALEVIPPSIRQLRTPVGTGVR